jgi:hypothetical protein
MENRFGIDGDMMRTDPEWPKVEQETRERSH